MHEANSTRPWEGRWHATGTLGRYRYCALCWTSHHERRDDSCPGREICLRVVSSHNHHLSSSGWVPTRYPYCSQTTTHIQTGGSQRGIQCWSVVTWEPDVGTALRCNDFTDIRESTIYNDCRGTKLGTGAVGTKHHPEFYTRNATRYPDAANGTPGKGTLRLDHTSVSVSDSL